jgi:predicted membrane protein
VRKLKKETEIMEIHHMDNFGIILLIAEIFTPCFLLASLALVLLAEVFFDFWDYEFKIHYLFFQCNYGCFFGLGQCIIILPQIRRPQEKQVLMLLLGSL